MTLKDLIVKYDVKSPEEFFRDFMPFGTNNEELNEALWNTINNIINNK